MLVWVDHALYFVLSVPVDVVTVRCFYWWMLSLVHGDSGGCCHWWMSSVGDVVTDGWCQWWMLSLVDYTGVLSLEITQGIVCCHWWIMLVRVVIFMSAGHDR